MNSVPRAAGLSPYPATPNRVTDPDETEIPPGYIRETMRNVLGALAKIATAAEDRTLRFNEYQVKGFGDAETSISLTPDFEFTEIVESVIINGPPAAACTVQLGKRTWNIVMPASGIVPISPVRLYLSRSDPRTLTSATAGQWSLELCGYCDSRWTA